MSKKTVFNIETNQEILSYVCGMEITLKMIIGADMFNIDGKKAYDIMRGFLEYTFKDDGEDLIKLATDYLEECFPQYVSKDYLQYIPQD